MWISDLRFESRRTAEQGEGGEGGGLVSGAGMDGLDAMDEVGSLPTARLCNPVLCRGVNGHRRTWTNKDGKQRPS